MADRDKCAHEGCGCMVTGDAEYCSSFCESAEDSDVVELACECGHSGCSGEM